jgi:pimeloyl-ACP methyl ester carboxylesterase
MLIACALLLMPSALQTPGVGTALFAQRDGQHIHVWEKVAEGWHDEPPPVRRAVVFMHGATWSGRPDFDLQVRDYSVMDHFARHGWAAYAVDVQGYGASDDPEGENWCEAKDAALDLEVAIELICERAGVQQVSLLGWSWGCQVTGRYAQLHPERVDRLVLQGGHYRIKHNPEPPVHKIRVNDASGAASDFIEGCFEQDVVDHYVRDCLLHDPDSPNGVMRDFTAGTPALLEPEKLAMPTLMIFGEHELYPGRLADACDFFEQLAARHKRLLVLPGGGHAILLEKPHRAWQDEVRRFFEQP